MKEEQHSDKTTEVVIEKTNWVIDHLNSIGPIVMIVSLFFGNFLKSSMVLSGNSGVYQGYKYVFDGEQKIALLLLICPIIALLASSIGKSSEKFIRLAMPILAIIAFFMLKHAQSVLGMGELGISAKIAIGGGIYVLGVVLSLVGAGADYFEINLHQKIDQIIKR